MSLCPKYELKMQENHLNFKLPGEAWEADPPPPETNGTQQWAPTQLLGLEFLLEYPHPSSSSLKSSRLILPPGSSETGARAALIRVWSCQEGYTFRLRSQKKGTIFAKNLKTKKSVFQIFFEISVVEHRISDFRTKDNQKHWPVNS